MIAGFGATQLLVCGTVLHLVVDWLLQNRWIATKKVHLWHPLAWFHARTNGFVTLLIFPPLAALSRAIAHLLVNTRRPLAWWDRIYQRVSLDDGRGEHSAIWSDQVVHIGTIAVTALIVVHVSCPSPAERPIALAAQTLTIADEPCGEHET